MSAAIGKPIKLGWILAAMALGVALGLLVGDDGRLAGLPLVSLGGFLGSAFLNLLRMLVVPLVVSSIISGIAAMGNTRDLGRLGVLSLLFYVLTTLIAVVIALVVSNVIAPASSMANRRARRWRCMPMAPP
jgi:proton glutamate symport protein